MFNERPLVSLVTPSLNQGRFLEQAIQSVLNQSYPNLEYIIIDGGSTDDSVEIIRKYEPKLAYWVSEPDNGSSDAINKGWRQAQGDYLWILNSDDVLVSPHAVASLVDYLIEHPDVGFVYGDCHYIDDEGEIIGFKRFPDYDLVSLMLQDDVKPFPGCLMTRCVLDTIGYFDPILMIRNDLDYFLRMALRFRWGHLAQPTACFRIHADQNSLSHSALQADETLLIYDRVLNAPELAPEIKEQEQKIRGMAHYIAAVRCFRGGHAATTRQHIIQALRHSPHLILNGRLWAELLLSLLGDRGMAQVRSFLLQQYKRRYWNRFD